MSPFLTRLAFLLHRAIPRDKSFFKPLTHAGGDNRDRTDDPLLAKQVLSQLSYTPVSFDPASIQLFSSYSPEGRALKIKQLLDTPSSLEPRN